MDLIYFILMAIKVSVKSLFKQFEVVKRDSEQARDITILIVPEKDFDKNKNVHPLEGVLKREGIAYDFAVQGDSRIGEKGYWTVELCQMEIIY